MRNMTTSEASEASEHSVSIPAGLMPVDASDARDTVRATLESATGTVTLEVEDGPVSLCSLQMLISTQKTIEANGLNLKLGPNATERFEEIELT